MRHAAHHAPAEAWCSRLAFLTEAGMQTMQEEEYRQAALAAPQPQQGAAPDQALIARIMSGVQTAMRVRTKHGWWLPVRAPIRSWVLQAHRHLHLMCPKLCQ